MKQIHRLESQRSRLFKELEKAENVPTRLSVEKMILDIDIKTINLVAKSIVSENFMQGYVIAMNNKC